MSWSINMVGKPLDVIATVDKEPYVPQPLKDMVRELGLIQAKLSTPQAIAVKSSGHYDGTWGGCVSDFSIVQATLAPPIPIHDGPLCGGGYPTEGYPTNAS